jgi:hypothetical protein
MTLRIRKLIVRGPGREAPTVIITNWTLPHRPSNLIERARRRR